MEKVLADSILRSQDLKETGKGRHVPMELSLFQDGAGRVGWLILETRPTMRPASGTFKGEL